MSFFPYYICFVGWVLMHTMGVGGNRWVTNTQVGYHSDIYIYAVYCVSYDTFYLYLTNMVVTSYVYIKWTASIFLNRVYYRIHILRETRFQSCDLPVKFKWRLCLKIANPVHVSAFCNDWDCSLVIVRFSRVHVIDFSKWNIIL